MFKCPISVANRIEKLQQDFLWNGRGMENKFHLVDWKSVCKSKFEGGLGLRPVTLMNHALLGKWLWWLGNETEGLWRQLVLAKYGRIREGWEIKERNYKASTIWKGITSNNASFMKYIRYRVGSWEKIQFWLDVWEGNTPLVDQYPDLFRCALDKGVKIQNYFERQGPGAQVIWGPTFRRYVKENEENQLASLIEFVKWHIHSGEWGRCQIMECL